MCDWSRARSQNVLTHKGHLWLDRDGLTDSVVDNIEAELSLEEEVARLFWVTTVPTAGSANA